MCENCGHGLDIDANYCPACGQQVKGVSPKQNISSVNGDIHAIQVGGNLVVSQNAGVNQKHGVYHPVPKWRSPITQSVLTWMSVLLGVASLFGISLPLVSFLRGNVDNYVWSILLDLQENNGGSWGVIIGVALLIILVLLLRLRQIAKNETREPFPGCSNWAISGLGHRITIEKIDVDPCPECGGKMKYYNKPVDWNPQGKITEKRPALECRRNKKEHVFFVDKAEDLVE